MIYNIFVWTLWTIETVILGTLATIAGIFGSSGKLSHLIARFWSKCFIYSSGIKVRITGRENLITNGPQIFISNHQGYFDIFSLTAFFPVQLRWIAKKELFKIPFLGWAMKAARYVSIDRENKRSAIRSIEQGVQLIKKGLSTVIFPEGTRSLDGKMLPFKRGSLILIRKTNAPIVPVTISGSYNIIRKKSLRIHPGVIDIKIGEPIYTDGMSKAEIEELLPKIREMISTNLSEMQGFS